MIIVHKKQKWIYIKISKTAGTSIYKDFFKKRLKINCFDSEKNRDYFNSWLNAFKNDKQLNKYFIFTIIRNPLDRTISLYNHFIHNLTKKKINKKISFNHFLNYLLKIKKNDWIINSEITYRMFKIKYKKLVPSPIDQYSSCFLNNKSFINYIGYFENLDESIKHICNKINIKYSPLNKINVSKNNKINITKSNKAKITNIYENDFKYFFPYIYRNYKEI